jgi:hypothetical protein
MTVRLQNRGLAAVTAALVAAAAFKYMQWGVGSDPGATSNVLGSTTGTTEARTVGTVSQVTTTVTNDTYQVVGAITALETLSVTELGLFDAAGSGSPPTGGNMAWYAVFSSIGLSSGDSVTFTAQVQFQ